MLLEEHLTLIRLFPQVLRHQQFFCLSQRCCSHVHSVLLSSIPFCRRHHVDDRSLALLHPVLLRLP